MAAKKKAPVRKRTAKKETAKKKAVTKRKAVPKNSDQQNRIAFDLVAAGFPEEAPIHGMDQRQIDFVDNLILTRGNKAKAYMDAGYQCKSSAVASAAATQALKSIKVQRLLAFRIDQLRRAAKIEVRQVAVIQELNRLAYSDLSDVVSWNEDGSVFLTPSSDLPKDVTAAIKKVKTTKRTVYTKDGEIETVTTEVEMHSKQAALDILSRASKLVDAHEQVPQRVSLTFNIGGNQRRTPVTLDVDSSG